MALWKAVATGLLGTLRPQRCLLIVVLGSGCLLLLLGWQVEQGAGATRVAAVPAASGGRFDGRADAFEQWLRSLGATGLSHLHIRATADGASITAASPIVAGEELLAVPRAAWLSKESALREGPLQDVLLDLFEGRVPVVLDELDVVVLHVMAERLLGGASRFSAYLALLPPEPATIEAWSEAELTSLHDGALVAAAASRRAQIAADYRQVVGQLQELYPRRFQNYTEVLYRWARSVVETRVFGIDGVEPAPGVAPGTALAFPPTYLMLPLADLLNHEPLPDDAGSS